MDITKSQSDFEAWFKRDFHPDKSGPYLKDMLKKAFEAGRESIEVVIPPFDGYKDHVAKELQEALKIALRTAGIRIKGESE
ncbi:hypothetical protein DVP82_23170 [Yersinia enterocolitica]|uniref:hypothetical protein n=1 Tax=Yersinia enterocolitica TaxID=630 RepID=UPI002AC4CBD7|nr:hypothetical protein [Yersinia enterocolitica]HEN3428284.1 hypothetical protein [Yersinia enterocolitica]